MKITFYQTKDTALSINLLFDIIRQNLPGSVKFSKYYYTYRGSSSIARIHDVFNASLKSKTGINHVTGDFNYATYFMPKANTILTIHDLYRLNENHPSSLKKFIFKWFWLKIPILKSAVVTAVSFTTKTEILKYIKCPPEKIRVIYNCISADFKPVHKIFNKIKPVLLQVGTRPNKNLERVVKAIAGLECKLNIIGEPSPTAIALMDDCKIDYSWQSNLSGEAVIQKYIDCDMVVFVSTFEGFGLPIIEANTTERVVVTGNISAMPEIAGDAACLVDPFDVTAIREGIIKVIEDDDYRQRLIEAGRKNKERFNAGLIASQYYKLYEEVYNSATKRKV